MSPTRIVMQTVYVCKPLVYLSVSITSLLPNCQSHGEVLEEIMCLFCACDECVLGRTGGAAVREQLKRRVKSLLYTKVFFLKHTSLPGNTVLKLVWSSFRRRSEN